MAKKKRESKKNERQRIQEQLDIAAAADAREGIRQGSKTLEKAGHSPCASSLGNSKLSTGSAAVSEERYNPLRHVAHSSWKR